MLDISMFREHSDVIRADHDRRGLTHESIDEVIRLDEEWRSIRYDADQLRKARNEAARGIAEAKKSGDSSAADAILAEVADIGARIDKLAERSDGCRNALPWKTAVGNTYPFQCLPRVRIPRPGLRAIVECQAGWAN